MFMRSANGEETFCLGRYPLWEFAQKLEAFEFEILTSNRFVNPSPTNATPPAVASDPFDTTPNPPLDDPRRDSESSDGIDDSLNLFRWGGRVVEGFTPTGFDVLKAMWGMLDNAKHRIRRVRECGDERHESGVAHVG